MALETENAELANRLNMLFSLLDFNFKERMNAYVARVQKLDNPEYHDQETLVNLHHVKKIKEKHRNAHPWRLYSYDPRNVSPYHLIGESVSFIDNSFETESEENSAGQNSNFPLESNSTLKVQDVDASKSQITLSFSDDLFKAQSLDTIRAVTHKKEVRKNQHQDSVVKIINAYLTKLGVDVDRTNGVVEEDHNELAFALIERKKFGKPVERNIDEILTAVLSLDHSFLPVQGPPGTGKTFVGAHLLQGLIKSSNGAFKTAGITSQSWAAIDNLLLKTIRTFEKSGDLGLLKAGRKLSGTESKILQEADSLPTKKLKTIHPELQLILADETKGYLKAITNNAQFGEYNLVAATSWGWVAQTPEEDKFDYLVIDEAGQFALFDAIATCARVKNLVLLGDPQQLPQVVLGSHDAGAGQSVLQHIIGDSQTIDSRNQGPLLDETFRMRSEICDYVSSEFYDGKLTSNERCNKRKILGRENGLYWVQAQHKEERVNFSPEEARIVKEIIDELMNGKYVTVNEETGNRHDADFELSAKDFMVVAPYNAHVRTIQAELSSTHNQVRVGTVDKFQGQEAPVIIFSMASSNTDLIPPGRDNFIFSPNRLNVAVSRAQCIAIVIANGDLVDAHAKSIHGMEELNHLCRIFEDTKTAKEWAIKYGS